jgi:hypothetical protein
MKANGNERFNTEDFQYRTAPNDLIRLKIAPLKLVQIKMADY